MTTLNTIIEEEKGRFETVFGENLGLDEPFNNVYVLLYVKPMLKNFLTTAMQRAFEAGEREAHLKNTQDLITIGERIKSGEVTIEQYLERWRSHLDTLLSKIRS